MSRRALLGFLSATLLLATSAVPLALAATINVNTTTDENNADGDCSLREAVLAANTNAAVDACTAGENPATDTIIVPAGTYTLTLAGSDNDLGSLGDLDLRGGTATIDLVINGAGAASTIIQACAVEQQAEACPAGQGIAERVFHVIDANVTINGITVRHGRALGASGHGIYVQKASESATLALVDVVVTKNGVSAPASQTVGGGIATDDATLNLNRVTVSENVIFGGGGGGIRSNGVSAVLTMVDSTVSGNVTSSGGAGIASTGGANATLTNCTISNNRTTGGLGAGILNTGAGTMNLRSTTVTANQLTVNGQNGGGFYTSANSPVILRNSIIAGNTHEFPSTSPQYSPDCAADGPIIGSEGHNLIGIDARCDIVEAGTDLIGTKDAPVDPLLGPLADNGGPTLTHALLTDSPAVDGGNPAAPLSGGFACPIADQRGESRPKGAACDIGAVESAGSGGGGDLTITGIRANRGSNSGSVSATVYGTGIAPGVVVKLTRPGEADIVGTTATVAANGLLAALAFELSGATAGVWSVVATNPDTTSATLADAYTVEVAREDDVWLHALFAGRRLVYGRTSSVFLTFGNRGNADVYGVPIFISFPEALTWATRFPVAPPPTQAGQIATDWSHVAIDFEQAAPPRDQLPFVIPFIAAGTTYTVEMRLEAPLLGETQLDKFKLEWAVGNPFLGPIVPESTVALFVARAKAFATDVLEMTALASDAAITQYVRTQLEAVRDQGRAAATQNLAATVPIYSVAQLVVDAGQFAAGVSEAATFARDYTPADASWLARLISDPLGLIAHNAEARIVDPDCDPRDKYCEYDIDCDQPDSSPSCHPDPPMPKCGVGTFIRDEYVFIPCHPPDDRDIPIGGPYDPNDKYGPGDPDGYVDGIAPMPYSVTFENLASAGAAAQEVVVIDQLDASTLDLTTFSLGVIGFGDEQVFPPAGLTSYETDVDLRPGKNLLVHIEAGLDVGTAVVTWRLTALDPVTGAPPDDPELGFLPPNTVPPQGEGSVLFTVTPKPGLALGTEICNDARIVFDFNAPIDTPEWCNVVGQPEDCENCIDDDGDQLIDRADPDCTAPANGAGAGLADATAAKALDKCAKTIGKIGAKLSVTTLKQLQACEKAVADCVQLKPGDAACLGKATEKCTKARNGLSAAETKATAGIVKACAAPNVTSDNLRLAAGLGFAGEIAGCGRRNVVSLDGVSEVAECVRRQQACAGERAIAASVPRANELLQLGGWSSTLLPCLDSGADGAGSALGAAKRKAIRKCDATIQKAAAKLVAGRIKAGQACGAAIFSCVQTKPGDAGCVTKAGSACTKALAALPKLGSGFATAIAKTCGAAPLEASDLLAANGVGAGASTKTCMALGVPTLASVGDVTTCLQRQLECRADQMVESTTPRLSELLNAVGATLP